MQLVIGCDKFKIMLENINSTNQHKFKYMKFKMEDNVDYVMSYKGDLEIVFEEATLHLCVACGEYLEECICDGGVIQ